VKPTGRLESESNPRTRYNRGCFVGDMTFFRGRELFDIRNTKQIVEHASVDAVHSLCDTRVSSILQYGGSMVTYLDFESRI